MGDIIELALKERGDYKDICKQLIVKSITRAFGLLPIAYRIEFYMDMPECNIPYRDNPLITCLSIYTSDGKAVKNDSSDMVLGDLNMILNLCGMGLIELFPCGRVVLCREHYVL